MIQIWERAEGVEFAVRLTPRASRDAVGGEWQGALKVRLTAPPVDDRANQVLRKFLAKELGVAASAVTIISGQHNRTKRLRIRGVSADRVRALQPEI